MSSSHKYSLPRDSAETFRLDSQHKVWKINTGYLLSPRISNLPPNAHIADVATGTGVWLTDFALETSDSFYEYFGLDISPAQFPKQRPESTTFGTLDILQPIPEHMVAKFDVVHMRLLICGLAGEDWNVAARNLLQLLKPGGWVQWEEVWHLVAMQNSSFVHESPSKRMLEASLAANQTQGRWTTNVATLPGILRDAGFVDVADDVFSSDRVPETRYGGSLGFGGAMMRSLEVMAGDGEGAGKGFGPEEVEDLIRECKDEMQRGDVYIRGDWHVVTGRRAQ